MGNFMGYNSATELFTAIGTKIKAKYTKPSGGIPKSDLSSLVQTSLNKADSALQSETDPTVPSWAKQPNKPSYTQDEVPDGSTYKRVTQTEKNAWNGKQNALSTTQMQAVNSGITSKKVTQISTNQTNILYTSKTGAQNLIVCSDVQRLKELNPDSTYVWWEGNVYKSSSWTFTINGDGSITINGTFPTQTFFYFELSSSDTTRFKNNGIMRLTGCPSGGSENSYFICVRRTTPDYYWFDGGSGIDVNTSEPNFITSPIQIFIGIRANVTLSNQTFYPSLVLKTIYEQDSSFHIGALPNYDLTRLEAEDRAALAEEIDAGAKNKFNLAGATITTGNASYTISGNSITVTSSGTWAVAYTPITLPAGDYVLDLDVTTRTSTTTNPKITIYTSTQLRDYAGSLDIKATGHYTLSFKSTGATLYLAWYANQSGTSSSTNTLTVTNMLVSTKAAFGVSQKFVPYRPNYDLVVSEIGHHIVDDGNTNHSTATCNCSNWTAGVYLVAVNRYQNPTTAYGTALYLMTVNDNILPLFTTIVETADCKATFALSNDKVLSITYPHSAFWQAYAKRI